MSKIYYKEGYKYQLAETYSVETYLRPYIESGNKFVSIDTQGVLTIKEGYAWDGASGPAIDTNTFLRGSLVHDALYQLIGLGVLPPNQKQYADLMLKDIILEDGMSPLRAWWVHKAVKHFGVIYQNQPNNYLSAP